MNMQAYDNLIDNESKWQFLAYFDATYIAPANVPLLPAPAPTLETRIQDVKACMDTLGNVSIKDDAGAVVAYEALIVAKMNLSDFVSLEAWHWECEAEIMLIRHEKRFGY